MNLSRRAFITNSLMAVPFVLGGHSRLRAQVASNTQPTKPTGQFRVLRGNAGIFTMAGGTIGWLATADGLAIVDTQFPESAQAFVAGLKERHSEPFDLLLNTHHHADHTGGNSVVLPLVKRSVAHAKAVFWQRKAAELAGKDPAREVVAQTPFEDVWTCQLGKETIRARYLGPAHTSGDAVIFFEKANLIHAGDLVFNRRPPFIDRVAGASIRNWIQVLEKVHGECQKDTTIIFGHAGENFEVFGGPSDLLAMRDFLSGLLDYAQKGLAAGRSAGQIAATQLLPGFESYGPGAGRLSIGTCLATACAELTES